ncbi:MAG: LysR family transcriptional regulator [Peptococcaceae bacterium]|nr:LysR family transcriptional regulator [Peptococcaceae bacterium]
MFAEEFVVFKTVAETNNITLAAKRLHISQPAISLQIQNIENYYGVKFFVRSNKGVTVTPAGKVFYKYVCNMLDMLDNVQREIWRLSGEPHGEVHLGTTLTIGDYLMPGILSYAAQAQPHTSFHVKVANTESVVREVLERGVHIGLVEGPIADFHGLNVESFWQDELVAVISKNHPWAQKESISLEELAQSNLVLRELGSGTRKGFEQFLRQRGLSLGDFKVVMELGSVGSIKRVVATGFGVTILSDLAVSQNPDEDLSVLRVEDMIMYRDLSVITNSANSCLADEEAFFVDLLRDRELVSLLLSGVSPLEVLAATERSE